MVVLLDLFEFRLRVAFEMSQAYNSWGWSSYVTVSLAHPAADCSSTVFNNCGLPLVYSGRCQFSRNGPNEASVLLYRDKLWAA